MGDENQYRCETCSHNFPDPHRCGFIGDRLANIEIVHIERVGCASHSDFQSEREKVLDIINVGKSALNELSIEGGSSQILQAKMDVLCWLEEKLQQEGRVEK